MAELSRHEARSVKGGGWLIRLRLDVPPGLRSQPPRGHRPWWDAAAAVSCGVWPDWLDGGQFGDDSVEDRPRRCAGSVVDAV